MRISKLVKSFVAASAMVTLGAAPILTSTAVAGPAASTVANAENPLADLDLGASFTSTDKGDGTYTAPILASDVPDVSVERVPATENDEGRDIYYMISTTMHLAPGAPIMKSYDLVNWETVNYVYSRFDISDAASLRNGQSSYGQGQWASSLKYHDGKYYVAMNSMNLGGAFVYVTDDIENGEWEKTALNRGFHDLSLFFDVDGTPYFFYGGKEIHAVELSPDLSEVVAEYDSVIDVADYPDVSGLSQDGLGPEGAQVSYVDGMYYISTITWPPNQGRQVVMFRSPNLLGRYTEAPDGSGENSYEAKVVLNSDGFAQGGLVEVAVEGDKTEWHGFFFRDSYPIGRVPAALPATWKDGWPDFGSPKMDEPIDKIIELPKALEQVERLKAVVTSDNFNNDGPHKPFTDQAFILPDVPEYDDSLLGINILENGDFENGGLTPWAAASGATIEVVADGETQVAQVTGRTVPGAGPSQDLTGKVQAGIEYEVSLRVKYEEGPAEKDFLLTYELGDGYYNLGRVQAKKGEWSQLSGTYRVADTRDVSKARVFIETPWTPTPTADDLIDYQVDDISIVGTAGEVEYPNSAEVAPNGDLLDLAWEWNHNPDNRFWSLSEREGWLRLTNGKTVTGEGVYTKMAGKDDLTYFEEARNMLSQRTFGPKASAETKLDISALKDGDTAGLAVYTRSFNYAAIKKIDGVNTIGVVARPQPFSAQIDHAVVEKFVAGTTVDLGDSTDVWLKADANFKLASGELFVEYLYSIDGQTWHTLGNGPQEPLKVDWGLSHFMGYRFGLFNYATQNTGGTIDADYFYLSDTLTADQPDLAGASTKLKSLVELATGLTESAYPQDVWQDVQQAATHSQRAIDAGFSTQNQIDSPRLTLARALAQANLDYQGDPEVGELVVLGVDFGTYIHGEDQPGAQNLVIKNVGTKDTRIDSVELTDANAFLITAGTGNDLAAGGLNDSWLVELQEDLEPGSYNDTVTVTYEEQTVTASVQVTVADPNDPIPDPTDEPTDEPTEGGTDPGDGTDPADNGEKPSGNGADDDGTDADGTNNDLPATGANPVPFVLLGAVLLLAGAATMVARKVAKK